MILKELEIFGFKSIPNRTVITFKDGIIALLGPNGCGKSNVVESIKFVLGEQSAKSMRAKTMSDIIFNGTSTRKPLNVAEVKLTLDNTNQYLSSEFSEVTIKRRVYRAGDSEYFINDAPCSLKDIRELFYDTGLGKSAYSIIGQGQIDRILANKPEDRRFIFEEAAGINKFKARREEAEKKLDATENNLVQIYTIMKEVSKSYDTLKIQAEKANKAKDLKKDIFNLEVDLQLIKLRKQLDVKNSKEKDYNDKILAKIEIKKVLDELNNSLNDSKENLTSMETKMSENSRTIQNLQYENRTIDSHIITQNERIVEFKIRVTEIEKSISSLDEKIANIDKEIIDKNFILDNFDTKIKDIEEHIYELNSSIEDFKSKIKSNNDETTLLRHRVQEDELQLKNFNSSIASLTDDIVFQLDEGLKKSNYSANEKIAIEKEIKNIKEQISELISTKAKISADVLKNKSENLDELKTTLDSLNSGFIDLKILYDKYEKAVDKFRILYPKFLDEFLSSEGIITKKRNIEKKIISLQKDIEDSKERSYNIEEENKTLYSKISDYSDILGKRKSESASIKAQIDAIENLVNILEKEKKEQKIIAENNKNSLAIENEKIKELSKNISEKQAEKKALLAQEEKLKVEYKKLEELLTKSNSGLVKLQDNITKNQNKLNDLDEVIQNLSSQLIEIKTDIKNSYDNFYEKHGRSLEEFDNRVFDVKIDANLLREKLNVKNKDYVSLGSINYSAPEEFLEVKERYDFLTTQINDLETAKSNLLKITEQIQNESAEQFLNAFNKIKKNFNFMFKRLFGGGTAEIRLTEPNDVLNSGIEIFAQPPGLNLQLISLLSGGQRSMTSVALIFAIFMVKPSPFCLLDEIDAALDDANIGRFVSVLKEFAEKSQFIVITHNKKTAAAASSIIGVTMEEDGVSVIFSTTFDVASTNNLIKEQ